MDRDDLTRRLREVLETAPEPFVAAYLFGSRARRTARRHSDADVGLLLGTPATPALGGPVDRIADRLEREVPIAVETVTLDDAPVDLIHRVLRDGVLLVERDPSARVRFEVGARGEYLDLLPVLRRYRQSASSR